MPQIRDGEPLIKAEILLYGNLRFYSMFTSTVKNRIRTILPYTILLMFVFFFFLMLFLITRGA